MSLDMTVEQFVAQLYRWLLGREPEPGPQAVPAWSARARADGNCGGVITEITKSAEFSMRHPGLIADLHGSAPPPISIVPPGGFFPPPPPAPPPVVLPPPMPAPVGIPITTVPAVSYVITYVETNPDNAPLKGPYQAKIAADDMTLPRGTVNVRPVDITNLGPPWAGTQRFVLSYRLYKEGVCIGIGPPTYLHIVGDVGAGYRWTEDGKIITPGISGTYELEWDIMMDGRVWMSQLAPPALTPKRVTLTVV